MKIIVTVLAFLIALAIFLVLNLGFAWIVKSIWNSVIVDIHESIPDLTFLQAFACLIILDIIGSFFRKSCK